MFIESAYADILIDNENHTQEIASVIGTLFLLLGLLVVFVSRLKFRSKKVRKRAWSLVALTGITFFIFSYYIVKADCFNRFYSYERCPFMPTFLRPEPYHWKPRGIKPENPDLFK